MQLDTMVIKQRIRGNEVTECTYEEDNQWKYWTGTQSKHGDTQGPALTPFQTELTYSF